jgi:hypothetical protein
MAFLALHVPSLERNSNIVVGHHSGSVQNTSQGCFSTFPSPVNIIFLQAVPKVNPKREKKKKKKRSSSSIQMQPKNPKTDPSSESIPFDIWRQRGNWEETSHSPIDRNLSAFQIQGLGINPLNPVLPKTLNWSSKN